MAKLLLIIMLTISANAYACSDWCGFDKVNAYLDYVVMEKCTKIALKRQINVLKKNVNKLKSSLMITALTQAQKNTTRKTSTYKYLDGTCTSR